VRLLFLWRAVEEHATALGLTALTDPRRTRLRGGDAVRSRHDDVVVRAAAFIVSLSMSPFAYREVL
jgi:hypothetical protein